MKTSLLKIIRKMRYIFAFLLIMAMIFVSDILQIKEVIIPEVAALVLGMWVLERQMWNANRIRIVILMTLCAIMGVFAVKFLPDFIFLRVGVCFLFCAMGLIFSKTDLVPIIPTALLPVYFNIGDYIYILIVFVLSLILVSGQKILEKCTIKPKKEFCPIEYKKRTVTAKYLKLLLILFIISVIPYHSGHLFVLAPPLIVTFVMFSNPKSMLRKKWKAVWLTLVFSAFLGAGACYITANFDVSIYITFSIATIAALFMLEKMQVFFPPSLAILLIPLILNSDKLAAYPFEIVIGASCLIISAMFLFKKNVSAVL